MVFAFFLARWVLSNDTGTPEMRKVSDAIFAGAQAFLRRQYQTIALLAAVAAIAIGVLLALVTGGSNPALTGIKTAIAFLIGAFCSGVAGYIGMQVAVRANIRTASAARRGLGDALMVSLRGGAVSGFLVISLSLLGVTVVYLLFGGLSDPINTPVTIVGFGFGASFVALFAQLGGGIYTKAADVGADLVGKVEAGIPEDDPRNPAVIADLVGDNVGDCAGRGADIFESTAAENIGAMILGTAVAGVALLNGKPNPAWVIFPLVVVGLGILCSMVGLLVVRKPPRPAARTRARAVTGPTSRTRTCPPSTTSILAVSQAYATRARRTTTTRPRTSRPTPRTTTTARPATPASTCPRLG
ncbi:MAG: sodium/proton-translocating pyrophosphatase, partial [Ktedonobacterales bacterium]